MKHGVQAAHSLCSEADLGTLFSGSQLGSGTPDPPADPEQVSQPLVPRSLLMYLPLRSL